MFTVEKYKSQVKFTGVKPTPDDKFTLRLTSVINSLDLNDMSTGKNSIVKLGFIAANAGTQDIEAAKSAVIAEGKLPDGWSQASTDYISQKDADSDGYFGCRIENISHEKQTEDIQCLAYAAYSDGKTLKYVWYNDVVVAGVSTNYDKAVEAWSELA